MRNEICDFSPFHKGLYAELVKLGEKESLFRIDCIIAAMAFQQPSRNIQNVFETTHQALRLIQIFKAGLQDHHDFHEDLATKAIPSWSGFETLEADDGLQRSLADKLYNVTDPKKDIVVLEIGDKSRFIAEHLLRRLIKDKVKYSIVVRDPDFLNLVLQYANESGIENLGQYSLDNSMNSTKRIAAIVITPDEVRVPEPVEKKKQYDKVVQPFRLKCMKGEVLSTLTLLPSRKEAEIDRIPYQDYVRLFFEMCDQPWQQISDAQKFLIDQFNTASHARFTNDWGTDVQMELVDEGGRAFTFCNSLIAKNVPGSEIFSAPRRDSVNGRIVSRGRFHNGDSMLIENLRLHFKHGCLQTWGAEKGVEHFNRFIEAHENHRYVGELGIGTNPHLKQHVSNGLLVEKIGGSFHLALGGAYTMTDYLGDPVHVDNGNRALDHWDITTMLYGAGGRMLLDGKAIMENGLFTDEKLDVLNRGWKALPATERPAYWQKAETPFKISF